MSGIFSGLAEPTNQEGPTPQRAQHSRAESPGGLEEHYLGTRGMCSGSQWLLTQDLSDYNYNHYGFGSPVSAGTRVQIQYLGLSGSHIAYAFVALVGMPGKGWVRTSHLKSPYGGATPSPSPAAFTMADNSDSPDDKAKTCMVLLHDFNGVWPRQTRPPTVDFLVRRQPAQFASA